MAFQALKRAARLAVDNAIVGIGIDYSGVSPERGIMVMVSVNSAAVVVEQNTCLSKEVYPCL